MSISIDSTDFDLLKDDVTSMFDEDHNNIKLMVSPDKQQKETILLKQTLDSERFFFVVDLLNFQIQEVNGIQRWLGYSEKNFSYKHYWNHVIHPSKHFLKLIARQLYENLCKGTYPLRFMEQRFASLLPLKHYNGHYLLVKKTSSTFQYDTSNRLIAYLNEFTIIGNYEGEGLKSRIFNSYTEQEIAKEKRIIQQAIDGFKAMRVFNASEFEIARKLAYNPHYTQPKIAQELNLSIHTIETYYKRFLNKAKDFFDQDFHSVLDVATSLRREGLV